MAPITTDFAFTSSGERKDIAEPPFSRFASPVRFQSVLRRTVTEAYRRPEIECVSTLVDEASMSIESKAAVAATARALIEEIRTKSPGWGIKELVREYSLSSDEGVALMCLAEALLRIPDAVTRDALIRDKISNRDWASHVDRERSLFVNAATWSLFLAEKVTGTPNSESLAPALTGVIARVGEPIIRRGIEVAMRMMGDQFVTGETIAAALDRGSRLEERGFRYSYDMLGESAKTAEDASTYYHAYEAAIHAVGRVAGNRTIYEAPGVSIKLSALHPRFTRGQAARIADELVPRAKALAVLAKRHNIGLSIDAEEADRLEPSLDVFEDICLSPELAGWNGLGFVVQAYGKRCPFVIDYLIDLARRADRRIMVRLVKGAYWDTEIKRTQQEGLKDFPVFTRKSHTDVCYIACAKRMLAAPAEIFPQFATHNAQTLASIYHLAGPAFDITRYEFQCLHGMGESLYESVVGPLGRPCRVYAPVGSHETLLPYLVRRLLENGANSSFVNRVAEPNIAIADLVEDPADLTRNMPIPGAPNENILHPGKLFEGRRNSEGVDLSDEIALQSLTESFKASAVVKWRAEPMLAMPQSIGTQRLVVNPGDHSDVVGYTVDAEKADIDGALTAAVAALPRWMDVPVTERAAYLEQAAVLMQSRMPALMGLIAREAGKTIQNATTEVREAIDFLRYYAQQARETLGPEQRALGPIVCISPWNFPLAIFTGQISAALVTGNTVLAKPAEETPLIAAECVRLLYEAGIPLDVLQLLPGDGRVGAALVAAPQVAGVMFTGSTEVARLIQAQLANRLSPTGQPIPLIAETGGQNAMIVDSSALPEQVTADVIASAFDSAGQRCSALRVLCLQDEVADQILTMLKGATQELSIGRTDRLSVDVGPVISVEARESIEKHIHALDALGCKISRSLLPAATDNGTYVAPTIAEIDSIATLKREVFGPVLHVVRYNREQLDHLIEEINSTGYGLTFGLHSRLEEVVSHVTSRIHAGNIYVNRNLIGAVVGSQPFGGCGLSGTGPKAGGPLYLGRLVTPAPTLLHAGEVRSDRALDDFAMWLDENGANVEAGIVRRLTLQSIAGLEVELSGPVGERNIYTLQPRGRILSLPQTRTGLFCHVGMGLAAGNTITIGGGSDLLRHLDHLPSRLASRVFRSQNWRDDGPFAGVLVEGDEFVVGEAVQAVAALPGPILIVQVASTQKIIDTANAYCANWLVSEKSISIDTTAAGGNAGLMAIA